MRTAITALLIVSALFAIAVVPVATADEHPSRQLSAAEIAKKIEQKLQAKLQAGLSVEDPVDFTVSPERQIVGVKTRIVPVKVKIEKLSPRQIRRLNKDYLDFIAQTLGPAAAKRIEADLLKSWEGISPEGKEVTLDVIELSFIKK